MKQVPERCVTGTKGGRCRGEEIIDSIVLFPAPSGADAGGELQNAFARQKTLAMLFSVFSLLSLVLTAVGLYGVRRDFVLQQRRELGIRAALVPADET